MPKITTPNRKPGRPRKTSSASSGVQLLSFEMVVDCAYSLCDTTRIEDLTFDRIARELFVSTTTVRHHLKTRKGLTTALIGRYYLDLRDRLPALTGDWNLDLENHLWAQMSINLSKPGFASYFFENRFSPELDPFGSNDASAVSQDLLSILLAAGLNTVNAALAWYMILHLLHSTGYADAHGKTPANQVALLNKIGLSVNSNQPNRAVLAALQQLNLPMIYGVIRSMLKHAIAVKFDFPDRPGRRVKNQKPLTKAPYTRRHGP